MDLSIEEALAQAQAHARQGNKASALSLYRAILHVAPNLDEAQKGMAVLEGGMLPPQFPPQDLLNELIGLYRQGQLEVVAERAEALILEFPGALKIWNLLGASNLGLKRFAEAESAFREAVKLKPNYAQAHNNLGNALHQLGMLTAASESFQRAIQLKPDYVVAYNNLSVVQKDQDDINAAQLSCRRALELDPNYAEAHVNLAALLQSQQKSTEAVAHCQQALLIKPAYFEALVNLGNALKSQGQLQQAISHYENALRLRPNSVDANFNLGVSLVMHNRSNLAVSNFDRILQLNPVHEMAQIHKRLILARACDWSGLNTGSAIEALGISEKVDSVFGMLSLEDSLARHRLRSENFAKKWHKTIHPLVLSKPSS
ncbi:tetratricopeptide repeat protein, partial [Porticoccaceae bacterium]|nr:tetratricopeptide repeat protein [Porticoccaceae bacterium]